MSVGDRLGIDIGGTFTDAVLVGADDRLRFEKVLTTPEDPSRGFIDAFDRLRDGANGDRPQLEYVVHATTTATNAVIQRRGAPAGLLVTEGFRDILEIARQVRYELYNLQTQKPPPLIPREHCYAIPQRMDYRGSELRPLDENAVARAAERLRRDGIDSIAICFLHSYQNPEHELRATDIVRSVHPEAFVSVSCQIAPEIREYWRASTTVVNAYVAPVIRRYLDALLADLRPRGAEDKLYLMQSSGGIARAEGVRDRPVDLVESGPAAGVAAGVHFAAAMRFPNAITFDMGGTTAKTGLILDGEASVQQEFEVGAGSWSGSRMAKGSGYPVLGSVTDLVEVGAGGGSIAWIDSGGIMRVGPQSAGAEPGPACYGRGGSEPTITDANLVLGRLSADYFLGGALTLDVDAAWRAIADRCAAPLGIDPVRAAMGIVQIANATMVQAMRLVSVQRGYDPREFCMIAIGGAGPVHVNALAAELHVPVVLVPPSPGVASALGMLLTDLRQDYRLTRRQTLRDLDLDGLNAAVRDLGARAESTLGSSVELAPYLELRYVGQSWPLKVPVADGALTHTHVREIGDAFNALHERTYGYSVDEEPVEIINIGLTATRRVDKPATVQPTTAHQSARPPATRAVYFEELGEHVESAVLSRYALTPGERVLGPAVIEEADSTTIVHPGYAAESEGPGILVLRPVGA